MGIERFLATTSMIMLPTLTCLATVLANNKPRVTDASGSNDDGVWEVGALYIEKYRASYCTCSSGLSDLYCPRIAESLTSVMSSPPVMTRDVTSASSPTWTWIGWCWRMG